MIQIEPLLHIEELSKEIGLNKYTIYKKIKSNQFPKGVLMNGKRMFKPNEIIEHYLNMNVVINLKNN